MLDDALSQNFLRLVGDSAKNGVPELHFRLWRRTSDEVRQKYLRRFRAEPEAIEWYEARYLGDDPDFDTLLTLPANTLGRLYARQIIDNGLNRTIATDYRRAHEKMDTEGKLAGMPEEVKYATLRGFQIHDVFHVLTGYLTTGWGEMALQAYTLAQRQLPYASIWMATLTAQMPFINPDMAVPVMDALSHGWALGRSSNNLNYTRWEERFAEPIEDLRREYGLPVEGAMATRPRSALERAA